jgi:hypothetical protein
MLSGEDVSSGDGRRSASPWARAAIGATIVSAIGYAVQTILDYVPEPGLVGELEFYGLFAGFAFVALATGAVSIFTGWRRGDRLSVRLGLVAVGYVLLAQVIQSLWD